MMLPAEDSSLEDDASVSDNLPAHRLDEEQVALVEASDGAKRSPRRSPSASAFSQALQTQPITVPRDPWSAIRTTQRQKQRRKFCALFIITAVVVAVAAFLVIEMADEVEDGLPEDTEPVTHNHGHSSGIAAEDIYDEHQRGEDDDLTFGGFDDDDNIPSESADELSSDAPSLSQEDEYEATKEEVTCPQEPPPPSDNDKQGNFDEYIEADKTKLTASGELAESTEDYRNQGYDGFSKNFAQAKENIYDYVQEYFVPALRNGGGSIYESACGTAANLLMTLEIIAESGVKDVTVYGSEYVADSVTIARQMIEAHMPESFHMGSICQADSTNLEHVPSNSMDVTFTGYIDPLVDPLNIHSDEDISDAIDVSIARCKSTDEADHEIAEKEQKAQEQWFARWVTEMIRITKPGGSVIVEDVAKPICQIYRDWGGVSQAWWPKAVSDYGWDIDIDSITFGPAARSPVKYKGRRYNVAMRKLG